MRLCSLCGLSNTSKLKLTSDNAAPSVLLLNSNTVHVNSSGSDGFKTYFVAHFVLKLYTFIRFLMFLKGTIAQCQMSNRAC